MLIELRQALISYQYYHMLLLNLAGQLHFGPLNGLWLLNGWMLGGGDFRAAAAAEPGSQPSQRGEPGAWCNGVETLDVSGNPELAQARAVWRGAEGEGEGEANEARQQENYPSWEAFCGILCSTQISTLRVAGSGLGPCSAACLARVLWRGPSKPLCRLLFSYQHYHMLC